MSSSLQTTTPATLHHLHITSGNPVELAAFYQQQFAMSATMHGAAHVLQGGSRATIVSAGPPAALACAGYAVQGAEQLEALRINLEGRGASPVALDNPLYHPGAFEIADPQGRKIAFGVALQPRRADAAPARLQHTVFQTTRLDEVVRFYVEKVGFVISDEVVNDDGTVMVVFLRSDDEHHSLAFFRGSQDEWDHHCYETDSWNDIRDWADQFARQRIAIFFGPGRHGPGNNLFFMVTDPDGNRLEFSAELQQVAADAIPGVWPHGEYTLNSWGRAWIRT